MDKQFTDSLAQLLQRLVESTGWTNLQEAQLGDGNQPATVIVPEANRERVGMLWCFNYVDGTKNVFQALNLSSDIAFGNHQAFTRVLVGYPESSDILSIKGIAPGTGHTYTGGALPSQIAMQQAALVTPDKFSMMRVTAPASGFIVGLTGGWWRSGNELQYKAPDSSFADLSSYQPVSSGKARYVNLGLDEDGNAVITTSSIFASNDASPANYITTALQDNVLNLATVYLDDTLTGITQDRIILQPDIFFAPPPNSTITSLAATAIDTIITDGAGDVISDSVGDVMYE